MAERESARLPAASRASPLTRLAPHAPRPSLRRRPEQAIAKIVCKLGSTAQKVVNEIVKEYKKKQGNDDVTIVVVQLCHAPPAR